jgi:3-hydroxyisobutyrate dehydrogenase-like beta-hydroxyacid dehydrogenase
MAGLKMRVGFVGLGSQGAPMAQRIIAAGFATTLWARRAATLAPFADSGAGVAASPRALAAASDLVCVCVVDDADVEQVLGGDDGVLSGLERGSIVAIHSTVHPDTCRRLAARAAERGVVLLDAPVSGGPTAASAGGLLVMVGGSADALARVQPVFATFGDPVLHLGPVGSGQVAKLLNNLVFTAHLGIASKIFDVAAALGVDRAALGRILVGGSARSYGLELGTQFGCTVAPLGTHAGALLRKDVGLAAALAHAVSVDLGVLLGAADDALVAMGHARAAAGER